jgi:hypothetical protein
MHFDRNYDILGIPGSARPKSEIGWTLFFRPDERKIEELVGAPAHHRRRYTQTCPDLTKEVLTEAEYFATNASRMNYPDFRYGASSSVQASSKPVAKRSSPKKSNAPACSGPRAARQTHHRPALRPSQRRV